MQRYKIKELPPLGCKHGPKPISNSDLDDVERYLEEHAWEMELPGRDNSMLGNTLIWLRDRFMELRAREEAKRVR